MSDIEYLVSGTGGWGYDGPGWYFWDETEAYCYGPYETRKYAESKFMEYCKRLSEEV